MKIMFFLRSLEYGGAERQLILLVRGLRQRGHDVGVLLYYGGGPLLTELREAGVEPFSLEKKGRWDIFGFLWRLVSAVRRERPDILHSYLTSSNVLAAFVKPFLPTLKLVWGVRDAAVPLKRYDWMVRMFAFIESLLLSRADLVICNSLTATREVLARGASADRVVTVFNGIDTERFRPDPVARQRIREELGIAPDAIIIGTVARIDVKKDFETLLDAFAVLHARDPRCGLCIVGSGDAAYEKRLRDRARTAGIMAAIQWLGAREDVSILYNGFDVACLTSLGEGFPNVVAEAMACGIACAVTDCGDSALIVDDPRLTAGLKDAAGLAIAIEYGIESIGLAGARRENIVSRFSVFSLVERSEAALKDLL